MVDLEVYLNSGLKGIFLLLLAISGNFTAETLSCPTQHFLTNNMLSKHIINIAILFFAIDFIDSNHEVTPFINLLIALIIYIIFILFTKMELNLTILVFILFAINYFIISCSKYYISHQDLLKSISNYIYIAMAIIILIGFNLYLYKQYNSYKKNWSFFTFIFGVTKCKSLS
tara:strand:- start:2341 stop:2856 length:516 start_codon:yes stop_codon:yes gene_type:complete